MNPHTGTVRLIDRRTRLVELFGSAPLGSRGPTDQKLLFDHRQAGLREYVAGPQPVGFCFQADRRTTRFLVDEGPPGEALFDLLARYPKTPARLARPYGPKGWLVEG